MEQRRRIKRAGSIQIICFIHFELGVWSSTSLSNCTRELMAETGQDVRSMEKYVQIATCYNLIQCERWTEGFQLCTVCHSIPGAASKLSTCPNSYESVCRISNLSLRKQWSTELNAFYLLDEDKEKYVHFICVLHGQCSEEQCKQSVAAGLLMYAVDSLTQSFRHFEFNFSPWHTSSVNFKMQYLYMHIWKSYTRWIDLAGALSTWRKVSCLLALVACIQCHAMPCHAMSCFASGKKLFFDALTSLFNDSSFLLTSLSFASFFFLLLQSLKYLCGVSGCER